MDWDVLVKQNEWTAQTQVLVMGLLISSRVTAYGLGICVISLVHENIGKSTSIFFYKKSNMKNKAYLDFYCGQHNFKIMKNTPPPYTVGIYKHRPKVFFFFVFTL